MWKTLYQSVRGTSHQRGDTPCQDSCVAREVSLADETVLILACSDGAGSAEHSEIGSRMACDTLCDLAAAELRLGERTPVVDSARALSWLRQVRDALADEADSREIEMRQMACTLLFAVLGERGAAFGQIGDGAIIVWQNNQYENIFWPQSGEYVNSTNFITGAAYESQFEFAWCDAPINEVALTSDGLQMLGLDFQERRAHGPFFAPMFDALRKEPRPETLVEPMRAFLDSAEVCARTDDDKTLVLATRVRS